MAERARDGGTTVLQVRGLHVYYGQSHALQGVDLDLPHRVVSVVGRNGMGKTTLCQAITGLVRIAGGSVRFEGEDLVGMSPSQIANRGVGYVPQGRRLWPSLSVDEHLRLAVRSKRGGWTIERIYDTFPRLAERRANGGGQLSGGEQQMLAIARALLLNPRLLVMDEPTEGLAPVIVEQVEDMLIQLGEEGEISVLVIEQNIGVATAVSEDVAIMVNGRVNRIMDAAALAADRDLQQRLLGVGRHGDDDGSVEETEAPDATVDAVSPVALVRGRGSARIFVSNPAPPTRWSRPVPVREFEAALADASHAATKRALGHEELRPLGPEGEPVVLVVGTLDTKGDELRFIRDRIVEAGQRVKLVDVSTSGKPSSADIPPHQIAAYHPKGANAVFTRDRGESVREMSVALARWMPRQRGIAGVISAGGSGGTALATPAMQMLPVGVPKVMISTVASGDVREYVGPTDIMMLYSVTDVQGLNSISRKVLANGAHAVAGMVARREREDGDSERARARARAGGGERPAIGLTMFGVTTPCVQQVTARLEDRYDCLVFHATGVGGRSMEKLLDSGLLASVIDLTTTEICDLLMGGVFAATEDRFGAVIRTETPYVGACGALDMVNFGARDTVPERYRRRNLYEHNPQVTLMRTTPEENRRMGEWIGERLNAMGGQVRFFLPEGGVSLLDAPDMAFHDPAADEALFDALERTVRQTGKRQLVRLPCNINDPAFSDAIVSTFETLVGGRGKRTSTGRH